MTRAGELRQRGTFQRAVEVQDATGEPDTTWSALATRWIDLRPLQGREQIMAQQTAARVDHRVTARYDATLGGLTTRDRLVVGVRAFDIASVLNKGERDREIELLVTEVV